MSRDNLLLILKIIYSQMQRGDDSQAFQGLQDLIKELQQLKLKL